MEAAQRTRDKTFRHLFKGSVLVSTLIEQDKTRFPSRESATCFGQRLLTAGHIHSVVGSGQFEDSVHLYRWGDESIIQEAKRLVNTTSSHIPKKRLIELLQYQYTQDLAQQGFDMRSTQRRLGLQFDNIAEELELERHRRERSTSPCISSAHSDSGARINYHSPLHSSPFCNSAGSLFTSHNPGGDLSRRFSLDTILGASVETLSRPTTLNFYFDRDQFLVSPNPLPESIHIPPHAYQLPTSPPPPYQPNTPSTPGETLNISTMVEPTPEQPAPVPPPTYQEVSPPPDQNTEDVETSQTFNQADLDLIATCRYDGVEMAALDLENIDFMSLRPSSQAVAEHMEALQSSLDLLDEQSHGYSDNEKQLLEQMKRMQTEHQGMLNNYEEKIDELVDTIKDLRSLADKFRVKEESTNDKDTAKRASTSEKEKQETPEVFSAPPKDIPAAPPLPSPRGVPASPEGAPATPGPPPPPPPPLPTATKTPMMVKPSKPPVKPRVKMRPLFWSRLILSSNLTKDPESQTIWHSATEPNFNVDEFERLFGRTKDGTLTEKRKTLQEALAPGRNRAKVQAAKILDDNRSRAVGIKMRSLHCELADIRHAVYSLDFSKVEAESLHSLAEMRATDEELGKIQLHLKENPTVPLDKPDEFLYDLSKLSYFPERMKCFILKKRFSETLFNIDQQLTTVQNACSELLKSDAIQSILELVLAFGNYMNGGTQRGQADGFDLNILPKLRDVKAMDNSTTLLHFIVRTHCYDREERVGQKDSPFPLPEQSLMTSAAAVSFNEVDKELKQLKRELDIYSKKAEEIYLNSDAGSQQPFKDQMDDFFDSAHHMLSGQKKKVEQTQQTFDEAVCYMSFSNKDDQASPESFFSMWAEFIECYRVCWKEEHRRIARAMFEKVEEKRKERMRTVKRRKSVAVMDDNNNTNSSNNLKQKFTALRRRSEHINNFKLLRSQSVNNMENNSDSLDNSDNRGHKSFSDYPIHSPLSTPSPTPLTPTELLRRRFSGAYNLRSPDQDQDHVFSHTQDDRNLKNQINSQRGSAKLNSKLISAFEPTLKTESKPKITVTNPVTNAQEQVTLRRDISLDNLSVPSGDKHPIHERIRRRRSRIFDKDEQMQNNQITARENGESSPDPEILPKNLRLTRPRSFVLDDNQRISSPQTTNCKATVEKDNNGESISNSENMPKNLRLTRPRSFVIDDNQRMPSLQANNSKPTVEKENGESSPNPDITPKNLRLTRPKSFIIDDYQRTQSPQATNFKATLKGPLKIDYTTDYVPQNVRPGDSRNGPLRQSTGRERSGSVGQDPGRDQSFLRSTENLNQSEEVSFYLGPYHTSTPAINKSCTDQEDGKINPHTDAPSPSRSPRSAQTNGSMLDVTSGPSEREYSEALRKLSRARRAQSVTSLR